MLFITLFAGIGGTSDTVVAIQYHINNNANALKLFWKDPKAFIIEGARLYPAVAGMSGLAHEDYSVSHHRERVGESSFYLVLI
jgi:cytochrome P450